MIVNAITDDQFTEKVLNAKGKVFVDFYADWCGPCQMMSPIIEEVAQEIESVTFYKINVDNNPEVSSKYSVMSIPTMMVFLDGEISKVDVGVKSKEELINFIGK